MEDLNLTSAFGGDTITVEEAMKDPTFIPEQTLETLDGAFLEAALFRNGGTNDGIVAFREAAAPYLDDDAEEVAEWAEIPVSGLGGGKLRSIIGVKTALAIQVSWEMRRFNQVDKLAQQTTALQNTMIRNGVESTLAAFDRAGVQEMQASADWKDGDADPMIDLRQAKRLISKATPDGKPDKYFGYKPDLLVLNEATYDLALFHESVQRFYRGDIASENPAYRGVQPETIGGLRVVTSNFIPEGEAYVMQSGTCGFVSEAQPLTFTPLYSPGGESGYGGPNQTWRSDAFRHRIIAVDNPKAVVKLTGMDS